MSTAPTPAPLAHRTLADRVAAARRQRFVGREAELAWFGQAVAAPDPPFAVLFVHGPGGIGKTTLLAEYRALAADAGYRPLAIDGRACEPSPPGFLAALAHEIGASDPAGVLPALTAQDRLALFIDTWEALQPLDGWLRNDVLPRLPAATITVVAGRHPPELAWRASPGWADLVQTQALRNLDPAASRAYLVARDVPPATHDSVLAFTHGHPLALSLVGDVAARTDTPFAPDRAPDVVAALVEHFIEHEPSAHHRHALEVCAIARVTTEALLARIFGDDRAHDLFTWLCGLSFVEHGRDGVFPHDLARDALVANLRWRHPTRFVETHTTVHDHIVEQIRATTDREQFGWVYSLMFLHRNNPTWQSFAPVDQHGHEYIDAPTADDHEVFLDMVQRHEGPRSAEIADRWLQLQPEGLRMLRDVHGETSGALFGVALHPYSPADLAFDPLAIAAIDMVARHGPVQPGDEVICARFCMGRARYRTPSLRLSFAIVGSTMIYTRPRLAWMVTPVVDPPYWERLFRYVYIHPYPDADVTIGGRTWHMYGHDWRAEPIETIDRILTRQEMSLAPLEAATPAPAAVQRLAEADFRQAVRHALRAYHRADALAASPLRHSEIVRARGGDPVAALRAILAEAVAGIGPGERLARLRETLRLTWLEPAGTQEQVAERLDLPFSTYRRHLATAVDRVSAELWRQELTLTTFARA